MAKRVSATAALLSIALTSTASAHADDGCVALEELVKTSVYASVSEFVVERITVRVHAFGRSGTVGSTMSGRQACGSTSEVTTKAFSESLASFRMSVGWNRQPAMDGGDYCLSPDLRQCYPSLSSLSPEQLAFVRDAWMGVRNAVASQMPYGTASNLSQFTSGSLDAALAKNLRILIDARRHSSYQHRRAPH